MQPKKTHICTVLQHTVNDKLLSRMFFFEWEEKICWIWTSIISTLLMSYLLNGSLFNAINYSFASATAIWTYGAGIVWMQKFFSVCATMKNSQQTACAKCMSTDFLARRQHRQMHFPTHANIHTHTHSVVREETLSSLLAAFQ